ncbi:hypothetical protein AAG906_015505 [Vitis piasezkii]
MKLIPSTPLPISRLLPLKPHPSTTTPLPHGGARSHAMDSLHHYLVDHPTMANFEWKQGHTWGASTQFLTLTIFCYLTLTYLLSHSQIPTLHPFLLRPISAAHNLLLLLLSLAMVVGCSLSAASQTPDTRWIFCFPPDTPPPGPPSSGPTGSIKRLSFLHVYHHTVVLIMCYIWLHTSQSLMPVALVTNASVHVLMYTYYLSCTLGWRPRWKRVVTDVQIVQFMFSFAVSGLMLYYHFSGIGCSGIWGWCFNAVFNASLWVSFLTFISGTMPGGRRRKLKGLDFVVLLEFVYCLGIRR